MDQSRNEHAALSASQRKLAHAAQTDSAADEPFIPDELTAAGGLAPLPPQAQAIYSGDGCEITETWSSTDGYNHSRSLLYNGCGAAGNGVDVRADRDVTSSNALSSSVAARQGSGGAADIVQIFRNVDSAEFDSIAKTGRFGTGEGQMERKWFATQGEHADRWGELLNGGDGLTVTTRIPRALADGLHFHAGKLDGVGPGYYADGGQLARINEQMSGIELWP
ncbi:hypothetical protein [Saccharopolyspora shandongensis]|uniref:hypothetical protein n=1 Tax=Saccharopolyspora shandongensis TaxID=418495 RepID=UPI000B268BE3|nr:hypothetical protein [Saccharopolyspora shandongensis]